MNFKAHKIMEHQLRKARYSFKWDFSNAVAGTPVQTSDGYDVAVSNCSILCKNDVIAENQTGTLSISLTDLMDDDYVQELYDKEYDKLIDSYEKDWEREHESDPDDVYIELRQKLDAEIRQRDIDLEEKYDSDRIEYTLQSILTYPNVTFKGSNDEWGAELEDEYIDELKHNIQIAVRIGADVYNTKVKTEYSAFIPSDEAESEMMSFMESEE